MNIPMATTTALSIGAIAPGVRQLVPLPYGFVLESRRDPLGFLRRSADRYGDVFRTQVGPMVIHLLSHPDHVKHVLQDRHKNYPRGWHYRFTKLVIGNGLVATEGEVWRKQRRLLQGAFQSQRVASFAPAMVDATSAMLDRWQVGQVFDAHQEMVGLTLQIVGKTLLGVELGGHADQIGPAVTEALAYLDYRMNTLLAMPLAVPTPRNVRFRRARRVIDELIFEIIRERRRRPATNDMLSMLLAVRDEETGVGMSDQEVRDQVITFIGAGHETTAVSLTWTLYLLSQHPVWEARLRDEVEEVLSGRCPTAEDLPRLQLVRRAVEESMRLYPPVFGVVRGVVEDDLIGGYRIPARTSVVISQHVTHRHPAFWEEPDRFDPDRFLPERSAGRPRFAYFPFLGGPHHCIGAEFAMMETVLIVAMILQRFRLRLAPGAIVEPLPLLTQRPKNGLPMIVDEA